MATTLVVGDIAIVQYNTSTNAFSFVFLNDVDAGTTVNFTDDGWLAAGGFRSGEGTVTYTAAIAITAGTVVTLTGLDLDAAGDQIIAYQGDPASPTILHLVDFGDGNNTVAGDATNANTTALPSGFTLGVNAVAIAFDSSLYAGPTSGSTEGLFAALNNSANWFEGDELPVGITKKAKPTIDLDSDNSTHTGADYETSVASRGPAVPVADADIAIGDDDGTDIFAAEIKVNGTDPRDHLIANGLLPAGIVATAYNPVTGILRLDGQASHADYEAAIRQVEFSTIDAANQTKRILVSVFDGKGWSKDGEAFIHIVTNLAAPPVLDLDANNSSGGGADATATYTAGGPAKSVTDIDVAITDADSTTIQSATITILGWALNPGDALSVAGLLPGGITASSYNPVTGVLTLSGPASLANYQTALHQVVYSNTLPTPSTADRGIQVTVTDDGGLTSNIATMYMHVVVPPPNVAPVLDLDANDSTTPGTNYLTGFTEGGPPVAIADTDGSIFDSDSPNLATATITLTNPQVDDVLTFGGTPPIGIAVSGSGTATITLTGAASSVSYQIALQQITFSNGNINPSNVTRVVEVVVNDGVSNSNTATTVVQVEAVNNSAPVVDLDPNESGGSIRGTFHTAFTENGTPIPIADTDTTITDLDSATLVSAKITLANHHPGDLLTTLSLPGSIVASSYDPASGVLTLTGVATLGEYEAALQQVLYSNTSDNPVTEDRLIEVVVNDGANTSNVAATLIGVTAVNDAPVLDVDTTAVYVENAAPIALSPLTTLTDVDDTELNDLVVRITGGGIAGDGDTLTVGGLTSGTINGITFLWHPEDHALVFTGASLVANYQDLLRQVAFHSTSDNPTEFNASPTRTVGWSVSGGIAVTTATTTLDIVAVNDAPQATVAAAAYYTENGAPVVLSPASSVTEVDNTNLISGEVRIVAGEVGGDLLTVGGLQSGTFAGIEFSYNAALHSLTFTHPTTVADYQAFLQAIEFSSTSDNPTDSGLSPTRTLSWFVFDGDAFSDVQKTIVSITAVNDAPVAGDDSATVNEGAAVTTGNVLSNDTDVDSPLTVASITSFTQGANGSVVNNGDGTFTYTHNGSETTSDSFTYTITDDGGLNSTATVHITVNPVNDAPVAQAGSNSGNEDTPITGNVVATDVDGPSLTYSLGAQATHGIVAVNPDGSYTYTPSLNFNGADSFTFTASDGTATSNTATISLTVNPVNDVPVNTVPGPRTVNEDTTLAMAGVSVADVDGGPLTTALTVTSGTLNVTAGAGVTGNGTAAVTITGTAAQINTALAGLNYRGNLNFNGPDTLTVTTGDGTAHDIDTVAITVNPVNDPPALPSPKILRVNEDTTLLIPGVSVSDVDSPSLTTVMEVTDGTINVTAGTGATVSGNGTAAITITGTVSQTNAALAGLSYTGNLNFNGEDFLFLVTRDEALERGTTILVIVDPVNDPPVNTVPAAQSVSEDTLLPITGVSVADVDSSTLTGTLTVTSGTLNVTAGPGVTGSGTAAVTITGTAAQINTALGGLNYHGNLNFNGPDTLTVTTSDGTAQDIDTVAITVNPVNDAPVAQAGSNSGNEDTPIIGTLVATDVDGPSLTYSLGTPAAHGTVLVNPDGSYTYTPNLNFNGADSFTFTASDGTATSNTPTISLTVNPVDDAPVNTVSGPQTAQEDTPLLITGFSVDDVDSPTLTVTLSAQNGSVAIVPGLALLAGNLSDTVTISGTLAEVNLALASVRYLGDPDFSGPDTLTVATSDGALSDIDVVPITVAAIADAPELDLDANDSSGATGSAYLTTFTENGLPAALTDTDLVLTDVDSANLVGTTFVLLNAKPDDALVVTGTLPGGILASFVGNELTLTGDAPVADYAAALALIAFENPSDAPDPNDRLILVTVDDGTSTTSAFTLVHLSAPNDAPVAQDGSASGNEDTPIGGALVATDVDGPSLTYSLGTQAANGTVVVNPDGSYTYAPNLNFNGTDSFTFTASDGTATSEAATISLTINPVNDAPVAQDGNASGAEDTAITGNVVATDVDGPSLTYSLGTQGAHGIVAVNPDGSYTYTPNLNFNGTDSFTFTASDGTATSNTATISLTVNPVNDAPVLDLDADDSTSGGFDYATTFIEGGAAVKIADTDILISASTLRSAIITPTNPLPGDLLSVRGTLPGGVTAVYDPATGVMTLTGTAPAAAYQAASDQIVYSNSSDNPSSDDRIITVVVNDGINDSNTATAIVHVVAVDDAPRLDLDADDSTAPSAYFVTTFAGTPVLIADVDLAIADPDSPALTSATIHLLAPGPGDHLSVNGPMTAGISASAYDPVTGILTLSGPASLADYQIAIHQVEFGTSWDSAAARIIEVTVNDGTLDSNTAVAVIGFSAPPEPPPVTVDPHWMVTREFTPHPAGWSPIIVADLAGDHMSDLLWESDSTGNLDEWQIVNAAWARSVDLGGHPGAGWVLASTGDFNGDGTDDIFWFDPTTGNTDFWKMANGEWAGSISPGLHPPGFQVAGTGDFDGDGTSDVLWFDAQTGAVDIWKIDNGQWAGSVNPGPAPAGFSIAATGDVNHDGSDDVIWFNHSSGDVEVWEMKNGQLANSITVGSHPAGYTIVGTADFTGDGTSDILWFNPATGDVDLWKMQDSHWAGSVDIGLHPLGWQPIGIGDIDGNGIADVWWREGTTARVEAWLLSIN